MSLSLSGCYVTSLAFHSNNQFNSRVLVDEYLKYGNTNTIKKLKFIQKVLDFAQTEGLFSEGAYNYYIETTGDYVSYIVQAAKKDKLEFVTWWFPIVGSVPYRGYFEKEERDEKYLELKNSGYDVFKTGASAFSTLGWLEDPIYGSMLKRSAGSLAHLFFHELTHRTYWSPGKAKFNENLAEYVADVLTKKYLKKIGRKKELDKIQIRNKDRKIYKKWLKSLKEELEVLYKNPNLLSSNKILAQKNDIFQKFKTTKKPKFIKHDYVSRGEWNNARVLASSLYSPDIKRFQLAHNCLGKVSVGEFLKNLENASDKIENQFEALDSLCSTK